MVRTKKVVVRKTIKVYQCDFCKRSTKTTGVHECVLCGKHCCVDEHCGDACEDGAMCPKCAKTHHFVDDRDTETVETATGKPVPWKFSGEFYPAEDEDES